MASHARPDTLADLAGGCSLPLTGAVIQYRQAQELEEPGGRIDDIGLALVLDGEYAASAEVLDLGSGGLRHLDMSAELVVVDWAYEATLDYMRTLLAASRDAAGAGEGASGPLLQYCQGFALSVLRRAGFGALTRPILLRIGYRDVVRDLDLNERTAVRIATGADDLVTARLDYDQITLVVERRGGGADPLLEQELIDAFPSADVRRLRSLVPATYQLRFALPIGLAEVRELMGQLRQGLLDLFAAYEPDRHRVLRRDLEVFGPRDTLAQLERWDRSPTTIRLRAPGGALLPAVV